jgi:TonB family protein
MRHRPEPAGLLAIRRPSTVYWKRDAGPETGNAADRPWGGAAPRRKGIAMSAAARLRSKARRSTREWAVIVAAALLLHAVLLLFFKPHYLAFLRREISLGNGDSGRYPLLDNPFQVIPLAPAFPASRGAPSIPFDDRAEAEETPDDFGLGEPHLEMPPLPGGSRGDAPGRPAARGATVQPKPLYIPWPTYPRGVKEVQGSVELLVLVNEKGEVENVKVTRSLPVEELNRIAVESARRIRFIPGTERGMRTSMWVRLTIGFQPR